MKALSIRAPWWWFILHGGKDIENRDWRFVPKLSGRVLIHASRFWTIEDISLDHASAVDMGGAAITDPQWVEMFKACGSIVGSVEVAGYVRESDSPWFVGPLGIVLRDPIALTEPIPCKGALGFFEVPADIAAQVRL